MGKQLSRCHSRRLQGLPLESPPIVEGQEGVTMERPASAEARMETTPATEPREGLSVCDNLFF